ncbi:MAG: DNA methyltransferase [Deltaproteobacteria bacterium]|nr:DNA methyltransferase [Deltaproteobacteria bacterium]
MSKSTAYQPTLFPDVTAQFPSTRYQGSKAKLTDWIWRQLSDLPFHSCLDAFGGTGAISYRFKQEGKQVTYNDILRFNHQIGLALIENQDTRLSTEEVTWLPQRHQEINYPAFVFETFSDIYFTDEENAWIDQTIANIRYLSDPYKSALAFFALCQACIIKRPYNLFHRKNLYIRMAEVSRSFGNKTSWDRPSDEWFKVFVGEANSAIFDNGRENRAVNYDALTVSGDYDLVYIDPPYLSQRGAAVDYLDFYHFLEGLTLGQEWAARIDHTSKHRRLKPQPAPWTDKTRIHAAFDTLFSRYHKSILVVSYRSDGIPTEEELIALLKKYKQDVRVAYFGQYTYALSTNSDSKEILLTGV